MAAPARRSVGVMQLLLIRHAASEDYAHEGQSEGAGEPERPLGKHDRWRARAIGKGLRDLVPALDAIVTSPAAPARETAEIFCDVYRREAPTALDDLAPEARPAAFARWLRATDVATVAAVGHATHLPSLASWLVSGRAEPWIHLKRGGACLIEMDEAPGPGRARLLWVLTPSILRRM